MKFWILLIAGAVSPFLFVSTLPSSTVLWLLLVSAATALVPACRIYCVAPLCFLLATLSINERLSERLPPEHNGSVHTLNGIIASLPDRRGDVVRFRFRPERAAKYIPSLLSVSWYADRFGDNERVNGIPPLRAGQRWRLQLELRTPRGRVNFHGVDAERWYFANGIGARALVKKGDNELLAGPDVFDLQHWREKVLAKMSDVAGEAPAFRVLAALAIADRRNLSKHDRNILAATGTGHLLAISGLHIGLAAALGFYTGRLGLLFMTLGFRQGVGVVLPWVTAWLAALSYSALSGFGVSTQRALIMLTVATLVVLTRRSIHPLQAWLVALALVLIADPFAPLRAGFWFSFCCVAVLIMLFVPRHGAVPAWRRVLLAQAGISLVMAPLGMYWFQQASLPGLVANLVAIPVVSVLVVPMILLALPLMWLPGSLAVYLLNAAGHVSAWLLLFLDGLGQMQPAFFSATRSPGLLAVVIAMFGAVLLMLPRGIPGRFLGLLLFLPLMWPAKPWLDEGHAYIDMLDVGQGLAVLLTTQNFQLLYDTGPGNGILGEGGWNLVDNTIRPMITASGRHPDVIVASHADLDHAGGLQGLLNTYRDARFIGSFPEQRPGIEPCIAPREWVGGNLVLTILHPSSGLPYLGNRSSCVLSVRGPGLGILLGGDIDEAVERRLASRGLARHDVLVAPHHGSSSSSSRVLIEAVQPVLALVSAAADNRYAFPHGDVLARYAAADVPVLNTAQCGGLRIIADGRGGIKVRFARRVHKAIWRYPADGSCNLP
ncbi:MAG: DNA internalization-related competence protein ComEC/Rec2 [Xanthomonadales bacterium]|nr:DNA internalization-related competence protein ComEC/Rec2 [Xanthomonadales bacterium]